MQTRFNEIVEYLEKELKTLKTGRANAGIFEHVQVNAYGALTPLNQVANITVKDAKNIIIEPWDKGIMKNVEKAIAESDLGLNPGNEGDKLRIVLPDMTEERRVEIVKVMKEKLEEARIKIRQVREEERESLKKQKNAGDISEDQMKLEEENLQKLVDEFNGKVKELGEEKEQEIMSV